MALYVAICLLAAFAALPETDVHAPCHGDHLGGHHRAGGGALVRVPGVGPHGRRRMRPAPRRGVAGAQLAGAAAALLASVPVLLFPDSVELVVGRDGGPVAGASTRTAGRTAPCSAGA